MDTSISTNYCLGDAQIASEIIENAVNSLKEGPKFLDLSSTKPTVYRQKKNWFYFEMVYVISHLNSSQPVENLLLKLAQKISDLGFPVTSALLLFVKGCHGNRPSDVMTARMPFSKGAQAVRPGGR